MGAIGGYLVSRAGNFPALAPLFMNSSFFPALVFLLRYLSGWFLRPEE